MYMVKGALDIIVVYKKKIKLYKTCMLTKKMEIHVLFM